MIRVPLVFLASDGASSLANHLVLYSGVPDAMILVVTLLYCYLGDGLAILEVALSQSGDSGRVNATVRLADGR